MIQIQEVIVNFELLINSSRDVEGARVGTWRVRGSGRGGCEGRDVEGARVGTWRGRGTGLDRIDHKMIKQVYIYNSELKKTGTLPPKLSPMIS